MALNPKERLPHDDVFAADWIVTVVILGTGISNSDRKSSSVATSLAMTYRGGTTGSGILTINRCFPTTASKTLLEPPSATFSHRTGGSSS